MEPLYTRPRRTACLPASGQGFSSTCPLGPELITAILSPQHTPSTRIMLVRPGLALSKPAAMPAAGHQDIYRC